MMSNNGKKVIVVGGGPAGMFAAWYLAGYCEVHLFEQSSSLGRKLLVAGKGGLNITNHSARKIRAAYIPEGFMNQALDVFNNDDLCNWLYGIGIPTYIGSSGKVFPQKGIKALEVVQKMTDALISRNVIIHLNHRLISFTDNNTFTFELTGNSNINEYSSSPAQSKPIKFIADYCILALGGASWPQTGSTGLWVNMFRESGIGSLPFLPSNCGINIEWPANIRQFHEGKPLKNILISAVEGGVENMTSLGYNEKDPSTFEYDIPDNPPSIGEAVITKYGLEGAAVYGTIPTLRRCLVNGTKMFISIDFKPLNTLDQLIRKVTGEKSNSKRTKLITAPSYIPDFKSLLSLQTQQMALIKAFTPKETHTDIIQFCQAVKNLVVPVHSLRPVEEAISVVGGVSLAEINGNLSLKSNSSIFVIGEMVNWDAPTGGFLLQGCFSMAALAAETIIKG